MFFIVLPLVILLAGFFLYTGKQKSFLNYREARPEELDKLQELGLLAYSQYKTILGEGWTTMERNLKNHEVWTGLMNKSTVFICEDYNKTVGMAFFIPSGHADDIYEAQWCQVRMVGIHPDYSGKGIAKKLMDLCITEARNRNEKTMALHTSEFMDAARHIYEKLGFTILKEISPRFGKRYWLYTKTL
jgi:ribosomal protein S18 acetylase RimI-like enzyme